MVTRTTKFTKATVMVVNVTTAEVENRVISIPKTFKKDKALSEAIQTELEKESKDLKLVSVITQEQTEKLLGQPDDVFNTYAVELDPVTRKPLEEKSM